MLFGAKNRLDAAISGYASVLREHIWRLDEIDRARALLIASSTLGVLADTHGAEFIDAPETAPEAKLKAVIENLVASIDGLNKQIVTAQGAEMNEIMSYIAGFETVALVLGLHMVPDAKPVLVDSWQKLRSGIKFMDSALLSLRNKEKTGIDALPRLNGKKLSDGQIAAAAKFVPSFLRQPAAKPSVRR